MFSSLLQLTAPDFADIAVVCFTMSADFFAQDETRFSGSSHEPQTKRVLMVPGLSEETEKADQLLL